MELGEMKEEISYSVLACQSHLVDIFTWGRSDLVSLVFCCLEFASYRVKWQGCHGRYCYIGVLTYYVSYLPQLWFLRETSPPDGVLVAKFITTTD